jgi:PD-(D/E)XK endonuclease
MMSTDQKGNIAEAAIALAATKLGVDVYRPVFEGGRCDMVLGVGDDLIRVQCKWAPRIRDVALLRCYSARRTANGLLKRIYDRSEIDAFAAYCPDLATCYFLPIELFEGRTEISLRLNPTRNNQHSGVNWADDYDFAARLKALGAVAQLGERESGTLEVTGSIPVGSTCGVAPFAQERLV